MLATISDKKIQHTSDNSTVDYYLADVINANDYYSFGMLMPGRRYSTATAGSYRYGFNGKEDDNEVKGNGNQMDYGDRMLDVRSGRWITTDKFEIKYPGLSPYGAMLNNPIAHVDSKGDTVELIIGKPYKEANGEDHPYGHAALHVYNAKEGYDMVYDFGRYGKTWGFLSSKGEGILNVYKSSKAYLADEQKIRSSVGFMQATTVDQDKQVMAFFQQKINTGEVYKGTSGEVPGGGGTAYKLKDDYHYDNNNCMTLSCAGLDVIGLNWLGDANRPNDAMKKMESNYKTFGLTRTEYLKGGRTTVTYIAPPLPSFNPGPIKMPKLIMQSDNTRPIIVPPNFGQLNELHPKPAQQQNP